MAGLQRQIRFLASVRNEDEAFLAMAGGADIIDCKEPAAGALGAVPHEAVVRVCRSVQGRLPVSATIGDLPCEAEALSIAATAMANSGVDYVKVGLFPGGEAVRAIEQLGRAPLGSARLIAVFFADRAPNFALIDVAAKSGFAGVMLDTAGKGDGSLLDHQTGARLIDFVQRARMNGLMAGLAGSLRVTDVPRLRQFGSDVLGFRGALCRGAQRAATLDAKAVRDVRAALDAPELVEAAP